MADNLTYQLTNLSPERVCIEVSYSGVSLGLIYYEKAKRGFSTKPLSLNRWLCVDAKIEGLYIYGGENVTPRDILDKCQELINSF